MKGNLQKYRKNSYRLFVFLCCFMTSIVAYADTAIGKVILVKGLLTVSRGSQASQSLQRGSDIFQGDTLRTGDNSQSQIRFTDGGQLTLQSNSEFQLQVYQNEAGDKKFNAKFIKGAFRAVSGAIGKSEPQNYQVTTKVATLGIRGTDYSAALDANGELVAGVWSGKISLKNAAGETVIGEDTHYQFARVVSANSLPQVLTQMPAVLLNNINNINAAVIENQATATGSNNTSGDSSSNSKEICVQ